MRNCWINVIGCLLFVSGAGAGSLHADEVTIVIDEPMSPPGWALMERELLRANSEAVELFADRYINERGYRCTPFAGGRSTVPTTPLKPTTTGRCCTRWAGPTRS